MCGIAGLVARNINPVPQETVSAIRSTIHYRGRDDQQEWSDHQNVYLLHSRLSIIDLTTGQQPMWDITGRFVIIYNGEIYNYKELRKEYERLGGKFRTQSDTEVILEGFKLKGANICMDLNGMFAFAIWDTHDKRLFLARDHLGKKPLYWYSKDGIFYFSSTIDSFRSITGWTGKLSFDAMHLYSTLGGFPEHLTIYEDVHSVPHASFCFVDVDETSPRCERYWRMDYSKKSKAGLNTLLDEYEELLTDSIRIRLRSDVPLAITFSGGVDSGTIAAICAKKLNTSLVCYTIDYHTPDDPSEETIIAERTAKHLGLDWQHINFDYHADLLKDLPIAYQYYDQPSTQLALVYSFRLYQEIKPFATVVLSGNGADEIFTGYIGDEKMRRLDVTRSRLGWTRPFLLRATSPRFYNLAKPLKLYELIALTYLPTMAYDMKESDENITLVEQALRNNVQEAQLSGVNSWLDWMMLGNLTYATNDSNYRLPDISGLAAQVEVRSPFLDIRMVEFAARLPGRFKIGDAKSPDKNKYLPKIYYERLVPYDIAWAMKKGMGMNLQFGKNIVNDPAYLMSFENAYLELDRRGLDTADYREAWIQYRNGNRQCASNMMAGFMLHGWLTRQTPLNNS